MSSASEVVLKELQFAFNDLLLGYSYLEVPKIFFFETQSHACNLRM